MATEVVKLSAGEAALLVQMAAYARMSRTGPQLPEATLSGSNKTAAARLVQKGMVMRTAEGNYSVTDAGFSRVKSIY